MDALYMIAFYRNRRDETPNQELAASLARSENTQGIAEIAENLGNKNRSTFIQITEARTAEMTKSQLARLRKTLRKLEAV